MIDSLASSLTHVLTVDYFLVTLGGVLLGLFLGAMPGLGGLTGMAVLLPFIFGRDPHTAMGLLLGMFCVIVTSDTIPAVLFGVPGSVGAQATILDGFPMAKKGEAKRALGAAFTVSMFGGVIGALMLLAVIPVVRPLVLIFSSAELFALAILGMSVVSVLGGTVPLVGLALAFGGVLCSMIGMDPETGIFRWTFGSSYLLDGFPLIPAILGLFGIPEIAALSIKGFPIAAQSERAEKGFLTGIKDAGRNWFLMVRCSLIGVLVGIIPGLGQNVSSWIGYGHAIQTSKDKEGFGKGDIRGVIGPECANNATTGGALLTTLAFGVPGSAGMIFLMAALTMLGITPGPELFTRHLDITVTIVITVALANIMACVFCFFLASPLAKLCRLPIHVLSPFVIIAVFFASVQVTSSLGDAITLFMFGLIGWILKRIDWPRPPLALGLVLGPILGRYLFISNNAFGAMWLTRPGVIIIGLLTLGGIILGMRKTGSKEAKR